MSTSELSGGELWRNESRKKSLVVSRKGPRSSYVLVASNRDRIAVCCAIGASAPARKRTSQPGLREFPRSYPKIFASSRKPLSCSSAYRSSFLSFFFIYLFFICFILFFYFFLRVHIFLTSFQSKRSQTHVIQSSITRATKKSYINFLGVFLKYLQI